MEKKGRAEKVLKEIIAKIPQVWQKTKTYRFKKPSAETSLVVQWLRLLSPSAGGMGSIPGGGTRSCMQQGEEDLVLSLVIRKSPKTEKQKPITQSGESH